MWHRILLAVAVLLMAIVVLSVFTPFGVYKVYETRFSPDTFSFRATQHFELYGLQITPRRTSEWGTPLIEHLRTSGYLDEQAPGNARWHFVHGMKPGVKGWMGNAKDAYRSFKQEQWIEWSNGHPEHARYLWPKIIAHTRAERYSLVRLVFMELSDFDGSVDDLKAIVERAEESWDK